MKKTCMHCGKVFHSYSSKSKYCGRECSGKAGRTRDRSARPCLYCHTQFVSPVAEQKYCSKKCSDIDHRKPPIKAKCEICGRIFSQGDRCRWPRRTCSDQCLGDLLSKTCSRLLQPKTCMFCGKSYMPWRASYKIQRTCSRSCAAKLRYAKKSSSQPVDVQDPRSTVNH